MFSDHLFFNDGPYNCRTFGHYEAQPSVNERVTNDRYLYFQAEEVKCATAYP